MRQFMATVGVVVFGMALFGATDAKAQGFVFGGPLVFEDVPFVNIGISGENRFGKNFGAVFGVSLFGRGDGGTSICCSSTSGGGLFTLNGSYNFLLKNEKVEPFATAGISGLVISSGEGCGCTGGPNVGGGLTYWFKENRGIRGEYRVHFMDYVDVPTHEIRFGFVWRRG
jgi:hypothetical protein